jgi:hypothetical protein
LWIVPAKVHGSWQLADGEITFDQKFQMVTGSVRTGERTAQIEDGRLRGEEITFSAGGTQYTGKVNGDRIEGTSRTGETLRNWSATRLK